MSTAQVLLTKCVRFWAWITTPPAPSLEEAEARLAKAGEFYTDAQKAALDNPNIPENFGSFRCKLAAKKKT